MPSTKSGSRRRRLGVGEIVAVTALAWVTGRRGRRRSEKSTGFEGDGGASEAAEPGSTVARVSPYDHPVVTGDARGVDVTGLAMTASTRPGR